MTKKTWGLIPILHLCCMVGAVRRDQGIPDTRAYVGRVFTLPIPSDAFQGHLDKYEVTEAGEISLPSWLQFDSELLLFKGVASATNIGQVYICIKAIDGNSSAKDVFSIEVTDDASTDDYCEFGNQDTVASIILDATLSNIPAIDQYSLLRGIAQQLNVPESRFRLIPLHRDESIFDPAAIRAGPGNALQRILEGILLQLRVGCSGEISSEYENVVSSISSSAANGEMANHLGHLVVGWQVTSGGQPQQHIREKRNVTPFHATPVPKVQVTRRPIYTRKIDIYEVKEIAPSNRIVPTMSSPRYFDKSIYDPRHRHHHGLDPPLRHIYPTIHVQPSPSYRFSSTKKHEAGAPTTPLPTPVLRPERPTTITIIPTRVFDVEGTMSVETSSSEDVLSRWYVPTSDITTVDVVATRTRTTVEPTRVVSQTPNFKPTVNSRTKKLSLVAGKAWSYTIPIDTFMDLEDGNTRDLKLMFMTSERTSLPSSSWIQFDPESQTIYALPLADNIGKHEFILEAMDSEGASTFDRVELHVWQHPQASAVTHSLTMTVRYNKWQYPVGIDWQIEILNRLAKLFGDIDNSKISVLSVVLDPVRITLTNDTLPTENCPFEAIKQIYEMIATSDHHPTKEMKRLMSPEFRVQDISVKYQGSCHGVVTTPPPPLNFAPILRHKIDRINVTVGDIIKFRVPENTFYDFEDGGTRQLRLTLLTSDNVQPPKSYWLQFDSRSQEIYGLATENEVGRHDFLLNAVDSDDHSIPDSFIIHVYRLPRRKKPPVEFSIQFDLDFDEFMSDTNKKTLVASKLARLYGDPDPRYMQITNITQGSVVYAWSNKTLGNDYCPKSKIDQLVKYIINDDGSLTSNLIQIMEPEFRVVSADAVPTGVCLGGVPPTFVTITTTTPQPSPPPDELEPTLKTTTDDDIYITTIVPAIIIAVMLVIAAVVAYFLYWKKRKGKMSFGDKDFIGSGVPVVFAGELEEQKPDPGKAPAVLRNEKPPLSSDYLLNPFRRGTSNVRDSVPTSTVAKTRDVPPLREIKNVSPLVTRLYNPPPPFLAPKEPKGTRPKDMQSYRHATYVPP